MSVLFHWPIDFRKDSTPSVAELASRFAESPRLSQTAQRVAYAWCSSRHHLLAAENKIQQPFVGQRTAMSELHDLLWTLCQKLPTDFAPYGERDRDTAEPCADCSCGCRHFIPLEGESGNDWGVCANAKSPRAGLLTFEHQGCPQFESEAEPKVALSRATPTADTPTAATDAPLRKLKIDFEELLLALEGFGEPLGAPIEYFLDTETGEVIPLHDDFDDAEELRERIDADLVERYRSIEPLESHESFRIMEDFAAALPESRLKTRLFDVLSRSKPFRHFRDIVHADLALRDRWFAFRDDALAQHACDWLAALGIEAVLLRRAK